MPAPVLKTLAWYPTLRCPYSCAYCNARSLPHVTHAEEAPPEEWIRCFAGLEHEVGLLMVTGGEPSAYQGLGAVLDSVPWPVHVNTNLSLPPSRWITRSLRERLVCVSTCCQFLPDDPRADHYWNNLAWLREALPSSVHVNARLIRTQQVPREAEQRAQARARECGAVYGSQDADTHWLYRDAPPRREMRALCTGGQTMAVVMPDGATYRCLGHAYACAYGQTLGNVLAQGWGILNDGPKPCSECVCTLVKECDTVEIEVTAGDLNAFACRMSGW